MGDGFDWHRQLRSCLDSTHYCALSTSGPGGAWANPVFFSADDDYSLLFISLPGARHMVQLDQDPRVAVAIFSTAQAPGEDVVGVQLGGRAVRLADDEVPAACERYFARPGAAVAAGVAEPDPADFLGDGPATWKFVRITPTELWYFDTRFFGEERVAVPPEIWAPARRP